MTPTDATLLHNWRRKRDAEAFRALTHRYAGMVYGSCRRILNDATEAEDVAQECFELLATTTKPVEEYVAPWLHRVACNRALTRLRSDRRRAAREQLYVLERDAAEDATWDEIYGHVDEAISQLPDELRVPLVAHYLDGQTHAAIAEMLGAPRSTVSYRIEKGVGQLRDSLRQRGIGIGVAALSGILAAQLAEAAPASLMAGLGKLALSGGPKAALPAGSKLAWLFKTKTLGTLAASLLIPIVGASILVRAGTIPAFGTSTARPVTREEAEERTLRSLRHAGGALPHAGVKGANSSKGTEVEHEVGGVSGRVYNAATGRGIPLAVVGVDGPSGELEVFTGLTGEYTFKGLAPGRYAMYCSAAFGFVNASYHNEQEADVPANGMLEHVDFERRMGVSAYGRVVDTSGRPVEGCEVNVLGNGAPWSSNAVSWSDGSFRLKQIYSQQRDVRFSAAGNGMLSDATEPYVVGDSDLKDVTIVVRPGARISGRLLDGAGQTVVGMKMLAWGTDAGGMALPSSTTDAQGAFDFFPVLGGRHHITVSPPGSFTRANKTLDIVEVDAGETLSDLEVLYDTSEGVRLAGRVTDPAGKPLAGKHVDYSGPLTDSITTDDDGRFEATRLPDGYYSLAVERSSMVRQLYRPDGQDIDIVLGNTATVQCRVVDKATGAPVPRFRALAVADFLGARGYNLTRLPHLYDEAGRFWLDLEPGGHELMVRASGYKVATKPIKADSEAAEEVVVELEPFVPLEVRVLDPQGEPINAAKVALSFQAMPKYSDEVVMGTTGEDGKLWLDWLPPNDGTLVVKHPLYAPAIVPLPGNGPALVRMERGGTVRGRIVAADGSPPDNVHVLLALDGDPMYGSFASDIWAEGDEEGNYSLERVPAGVHAMGVTATWNLDDDEAFFQKLLTEVIVANGEITEPVVVLPPAGNASLSGHVLLDGLPFYKFSIQATMKQADGSDVVYGGSVGKDGSYLLNNLPPGQARISIDPLNFFILQKIPPVEPVDVELTAGEVEEVEFVYSAEDLE